MTRYTLTFALNAELIVGADGEDEHDAAEQVEVPSLCHQCGGWGRRDEPELTLGKELHLIAARNDDTGAAVEIEPAGPWAEVARLRARVAELEDQLNRQATACPPP